jgi:hypothetical protein
MLAYRLAHACLAVVDGKTFLPQNHRDMSSETPIGPLQSREPRGAAGCDRECRPECAAAILAGEA